MTDDHATLAAFLIAPIVPAVAFAVTSPGLGGGPGADPVTLAGLSVLGYMYALVAVGLLGLPAFLLLRRYGLDGPVSATVSATLLAMLIALVLEPRPPYFSTMAWLGQMHGVGLAGAATGFAFWTVRFFCLRIGVHYKKSSRSVNAGLPDRH
jgi:hypothetical protein